jgi:cellulose synthase/poly-beta-1,6-N-acetylglucosamine synthase-like glycosyltransferase
VKTPESVSEGHRVRSGRLIGSVLIPAHNEAAVIARCLNSLFAGIEPGELEVAVVCNGCRDNTAEVARSFGGSVTVIELDQSSKPAALRAGDRQLRIFPRLYLDADVVLPGRTARLVLNQLARPGAVVARPPLRYDTSRSSALVRRYYGARVRLPAVTESVWGAGLYGLSAAGRARFDEFPDVIADDLFAAQHFKPGELEIVGDEPVVVVAPANLRDLLKIRRRVYRGAAENRDLALVKGAKTTTTTMRDFVRLTATGFPGILDAVTFAIITVVGRLYVAVGRDTRWERDESSRTLCS